MPLLPLSLVKIQMKKSAHSDEIQMKPAISDEIQMKFRWNSDETHAFGVAICNIRRPYVTNIAEYANEHVKFIQPHHKRSSKQAFWKARFQMKKKRAPNVGFQMNVAPGCYIVKYAVYI